MTLKPGETATVATAILSGPGRQGLLAGSEETGGGLDAGEGGGVAVAAPQVVVELLVAVVHRDPGQGNREAVVRGVVRNGQLQPAGQGRAGTVGQLADDGQPELAGRFPPELQFPGAVLHGLCLQPRGTVAAVLSAGFGLAAAGRGILRRSAAGKAYIIPCPSAPWGLCSYNPRLDFGQRSDAAFAALNFIWYWQYTQDKEWLKTTGYPFLREVAEFWEDYLKFENGRYVIYNDAIHEGSGTDMNPLLSLGPASARCSRTCSR